MRVIKSFDEIPPVPWANGAGETTELISLDESTVLRPNRPRWRLSVARLERPGPFSSLPGLARTFLPVGAEVVLEIDGHARRVTPEEPARFDGDAAVELTELDRPCFALNLMVEASDTSEVVPSGTGAESSETAMSLQAPAARLPGHDLLAVTLEATAGLARFQLVRLGESDELPDHLGAAYLI